MKTLKKSLIILTAVLMLVACSGSVSNNIAIPGWLQGSWEAPGGAVVLTFKPDNILVYSEGNLAMDYKSQLKLNPESIISNQGSTDTTYNIAFKDTSNNLIFEVITIVYTEDNDTARFTQESYPDAPITFTITRK